MDLQALIQILINAVIQRKVLLRKEKIRIVVYLVHSTKIPRYVAVEMFAKGVFHFLAVTAFLLIKILIFVVRKIFLKEALRIIPVVAQNHTKYHLKNAAVPIILPKKMRTVVEI